MLRSLFPCFAANDGAYSTEGNAVFRRQLFQRRASLCVAFTNRLNIRFRQLGGMMRRASVLGIDHLGFRMILPVSLTCFNPALSAPNNRISLIALDDNVRVICREWVPIAAHLPAVALAMLTGRNGLKVHRIDASFIPAGVMRLRWPLAIGQEECDTVRTPEYADSASPLERSIGMTTAEPLPARVWTITTVNFRPESFDVIWGKIRVHSVLLDWVTRLGLHQQCRAFSFPQLYSIRGL